MENERVWRPRMESERVWRPRMEIERVWRPRMKSERFWRPRMEIEREWRLRGQGNSAVCKNRITELHRTLDSPVNFGPGEEVPHLDSISTACHKHHGNQRDGSSGRSIDWKRYVKDK